MLWLAHSGMYAEIEMSDIIFLGKQSWIDEFSEEI